MKEVLSANQEYPVKAEQLHADVDLITKVTRVDFEEACSVSKHFKPFFYFTDFLITSVLFELEAASQDSRSCFYLLF